MMNPGLGTYLEAKAGSSGFKLSVGSRSTTTSTSGSLGKSGELALSSITVTARWAVHADPTAQAFLRCLA